MAIQPEIEADFPSTSRAELLLHWGDKVKDNETRRHEMFLRVREYGNQHAAQFPTGTLAIELFTNLN